MKLLSDARQSRGLHRCAGIVLAECLVYISVFFILTGIAYAAFYRSFEFSINLRRNTDDIARALKVGEQWRQDVRSATGPLLQEDQDGTQVLVIPHPNGKVVYWLRETTVWRLSPANPAPLPICPAVKSSLMIPDTRIPGASWRWELELKSAQKAVRLKPLFSFMAAAHVNANKSDHAGAPSGINLDVVKIQVKP